jgi:outer membrane protein TolC
MTFNTRTLSNFRAAVAGGALLFYFCVGLSAPAEPALQAVAADDPSLPFPKLLTWPDSDNDEGDETTLLPIDLFNALRLAQTSNLDIALARETIEIARAAELRARVQILPNFNLGSVYTHHEGPAQKTEGNIIFANKDSLFVGGGPSLITQFTDVIYGPLVARQLVAATQAGLQRVNNDTLLAVAEAYLSVLRVRRRLARIDETLDYLASERPGPGRANSKGLLPIIRDFVEVGAREALRSELERVIVEEMRRQEERAGALEDLRIATAELARLIRLDPKTPLWPADDFHFPLALRDGDWADRPLEEIVAFALNNRPELAENRALVLAAIKRVKAAKCRPYLPNVVLNYNWGDFGGGPDQNTVTDRKTGKTTTVPGFGPSGRILHFEPKTDFDVALVWRLQNMGFGNRAEVREQQALKNQFELRRLQLYDQVTAQVVQVQEQVLGWRRRVDITRNTLFDENNRPDGPVFRSLRLNFDRIKAGEGRPLEVLDSIRGLNDALETYGQAITDYERARFRLLVVLGLPSQALIDSANMEAPLDCNDNVPHPIRPAPQVPDE